MQLALATSIPVAAWLAEPDDIIVTAFDILNERAERMKRRGQ